MGHVLQKNTSFVNLPESSEKSYHLNLYAFISTNMHYILGNSQKNITAQQPGMTKLGNQPSPEGSLQAIQPTQAFTSPKQWKRDIVLILLRVIDTQNLLFLTPPWGGWGYLFWVLCGFFKLD